MRKFKYIGETYNLLVTNGKVYDIINYIDNSPIVHDDIITLIDDTGDETILYIYDENDKKVFIDVTHEYRNEIIDNILE